jgi:hypothetical protein
METFAASGDDNHLIVIPDLVYGAALIALVFLDAKTGKMEDNN